MYCVLQQYYYVNKYELCLKCFYFYLFLFRERAREGERDGEKHQCERETLIKCCLSYSHQLGTKPAT